MSKKKLIKALLAGSLTLLINLPSFASSTSLTIIAYVEPVIEFNVQTPDNTVYKTASAGDFPVSNEITQVANIIDFGPIDKFGKNKGSSIVDQISLLSNEKLIDKTEKVQKNITGAVYIIGSSESENAVKVNFKNADISINKVQGGNLDLYYSDSETSWKKNVKPGDSEHPKLSENPVEINTSGFENDELALDIATKVTDTKATSAKNATILFTVTDDSENI